MATLPPNSEKFSLHVVGDKTDKTYKADFVVSKILSHRQRFLQDQLYREYLGGTNPAQASQEARERASILADINCSLVAPVPQFWRESAMGVDLLDDNVVLEAWAGVLKVQSEEAEKHKKKTDAATERVKVAVEKGEEAKTDEE